MNENDFINLFNKIVGENGMGKVGSIDNIPDSNRNNTKNNRGSQLEAEAKVLSFATNTLMEKRIAWHQQLLVASSALFGVLISLHNTSTQPQYIRLVFAFALVLIAVGILLSAVSMYSQIDAIKRFRKAYLKEAESAPREGRGKNVVTARERKLFSVCAMVSYICFGLAVLLLATYSLLLAL